MRYVTKLVVVVGVLTLVAGCGDDPVDNDQDEEDAEIQDSDLISELSEDQASELCEEYVLINEAGDDARCGVFVPWGAGEDDDPVQACNDMWDDCIDEAEGWDGPENGYEDPECPHDAMAECDAEVEMFRDCQAEIEEGLQTVGDVFECSLLDEDDDNDDVQTYDDAIDDAMGEGETCTALKDECEGVVLD